MSGGPNNVECPLTACRGERVLRRGGRCEDGPQATGGVWCLATRAVPRFEPDAACKAADSGRYRSASRSPCRSACSHYGSALSSCSVRIFNRSTLIAFWTKHPDAEAALRLWFSMVHKAAWATPTEIREAFGSADFLADNRVVFDIKGNSYRLVVHVRCAPLFLVFIRFIGTHAAYDRIDAATV